MKWTTPQPCASCPYRRDAELAKWSAEEFKRLLEHDADPLRGAVYGCHGTAKLPEPDVCAGWLLDQKRRSAPAIQLRLELHRNPEARAHYERVTDGGHALYDSIEEMVETNLIADPNYDGDPRPWR